MNNLIEIIAGDVNMSNKDRILSAAGGIALVAFGLVEMKKHRSRSWTEIVTGALLLLRGATGHCPFNAVTGRNTAAAEIAEDAEEKFEDLA